METRYRTLAFIQPAGNIVLRFMTNQPIKAGRIHRGIGLSGQKWFRPSLTLIISLRTM
jgi:hypothetical protein